ncbi:ABC transporter ATP-binding protein [Paenibacillus sp. HB172176]|uniref:ABC transporter ATP-binding protein n=1 Tax=Paenibacillus sp. HB172176 TaxID=2493690 RepID=UPI00143CB9ED|nr:ABC transporter ATP-binding protein [Paenibacillus sp. HB172176]
MDTDYTTDNAKSAELSSAAAIALSGLTKRYGDNIAVNRLDLEIKRGEIFGLLGPNGAGKTTTILMLLGLTEPTSGKVRVLGMDPARSALQIKRRVGYMPDDIGFYEERSGADNLIYTARLNGISAQDAAASAERLLGKVGLSGAAGKKVGTFSRGMRQRLGLADVLIKKPEMIILDEPTLGIDPSGVAELLELITSLSKEEGLTVLLSSHHLHQVQQICDRVGLFVQGSLIACGGVEELASSLQEDEFVVVELEVAACSDELFEALQAIEGVENVYRMPSPTGGHSSVSLRLSCREDLTSVIARQAASKGELLAIRRKSYNLDDIYRRYFEGGETDGA